MKKNLISAALAIILVFGNAAAAEAKAVACYDTTDCIDQYVACQAYAVAKGSVVAIGSCLYSWCTWQNNAKASNQLNCWVSGTMQPTLAWCQQVYDACMATVYPTP